MVRAEIFQDLFKTAVDEEMSLATEDKTTLRDALDYDLLDGITHMQAKTQFTYLSNLFYFLLHTSLGLDEEVDYSHLNSYVHETFSNASYKRAFTY